MEKQVRLKGVIEMTAAHLDRLQYALASAALAHGKQRKRMIEEAEAHIDSVDFMMSSAGVQLLGSTTLQQTQVSLQWFPYICLFLTLPVTAASDINDEPTAARSESAQAKGRAGAVSMVTRSMAQKRPSSPREPFQGIIID